MALKRIWIPSPNNSSRGGSGVRLVVIHTAEGSRSFRDLGGFFGSSSSAVSSHVGIDNNRGEIGEYVKRPDKAWTQSNYNPQAVSVELCGAPLDTSTPCGSNWSAAEWNAHDDMLANLAEWIAEECAHFELPITKLSASAAQGSGRGVCGHVDLGAGGGGHWDPGPNFPWQRVMDMARDGVKAPEPTFDPMAGREGSFAALNRDGRLEVFTDPDAVYHRWQQGAGKSFTPHWASLGKP